MSEINPKLASKLLLKPDTLWTKVIGQTEQAIESGALHSLATKHEIVTDNGIDFIVRILGNIGKKEQAKQQQEQKTATSGKEFNPFLPHEEDLFVADISNTHFCLLNKYNVVDYHLLILTRTFEEQENWLTLADFEGLCACLAQIEGLGFYNGGKLGGASQRHKHLQLVPFPLTPEGVTIPIETAIATANFIEKIGNIPSFPFVHALASLNTNWEQNPSPEVAKIALECYYQLIEAVGLKRENERQSGAYNLLVTRKWMLLIPRSQEGFDAISVNSLGFAGTLLVRNAEQLKKLKEYGPITILKNVAYL